MPLCCLRRVALDGHVRGHQEVWSVPTVQHRTARAVSNYSDRRRVV
jgi:hypothetical protein